MKRTRLFRSATKASSAVPKNITATEMETDSPMKKEVTTKTKGTGGKKDASNVKESKNLRGTVDLEMMKEELKQLEDPPITEQEKKLCSKRLQFSFFDVPCTDLAKNLLGKILVRRLENGTILKGRIVETEAYLGGIDKGSQTYQLKVTPRNLPLYMAPGTIYVYMTYGMYHCFNISSAGEGSAILLRGIEPLDGVDEMRFYRSSKPKSKQPRKELKPLANHELCNGPSKLCIAFQIDRSNSKYSLSSFKSMWIENDTNSEDKKVVECSRIGIDRAGPEWAGKPFRYYIYGNTSVSKKDKKAEAKFLSDDVP